MPYILQSLILTTSALFKSKEEQRYLIKNANIELNSDNYIQINSMYITENYLVDLTVPRILCYTT